MRESERRGRCGWNTASPEGGGIVGAVGRGRLAGIGRGRHRAHARAGVRGRARVSSAASEGTWRNKKRSRRTQ